MQVLGYNPSANNRFIDYKDSSRVFLPMCAVFVKKKKKNDLEMSHLYFKFPSHTCCHSNQSSCYPEKTDVFASIRMQSLESEKEGESNENSSFHYLKCELH